VQVEALGISNHSVCKQFNSAGNDLMIEYQERLTKQIMIWYGNIKDQPKEVISSEELGGILITTSPEDIFNIIVSQVEVAHEKLSWSR
jgi:hypothetical protein